MRPGDQAHPRSRGENVECTTDSTPRPGSSPLTRGKLSAFLSSGPRGRLIPAHAGKTQRPIRRLVRSEAHPRSRGENGGLPGVPGMLHGSSPLTRGKLLAIEPLEVRGRLIPAHAGKTRCRRASCLPTPAHPRSRGENPPAVAWRAWSDGSSPLTRGKQRRTRVGVIALRLIPAHAGKTFDAACHVVHRAAHPRSRGENHTTLTGPIRLKGSSPLTRGKPPLYSTVTARRRLIPAHAGKTSGSRKTRALSTAHPRSRGENAARRLRGRRPEGSSPLTRGKRGVDCELRRLAGLIPAHAGKTENDSLPRNRGRAHPRSRGENRSARASARFWAGSSPLTRGKRTCQRGPSLRQRAHPRSRGENSCGGWSPSTPAGSSPLTRGKRRRGRHGDLGMGLIPAHAGKTATDQ